jgi:HSP20 family protein
MKQTTTTLVLFAIIGFVIGYGIKGAVDRREIQKIAAQPAIQLPAPTGLGATAGSNTRAVPAQGNQEIQQGQENLISRNETVWRLLIDPNWVPSLAPAPPTSLNSLSDFPAAVPKVQTIEGHRDIRVIIPVNGLDPKDVDVQVSRDALAIKGQKVDETTPGENNIRTVQEEFQETIKLPVTVDGEKGRATIKDGQLVVDLPKASSFAQRSNPVQR